MKHSPRPKKKLLLLKFPDWEQRHTCPRCGVGTGDEVGYHSAGCKIADLIDGVSEHDGIQVIPSQRSVEQGLRAAGLYRKILWSRTQSRIISEPAKVASKRRVLWNKEE